MARTPAKCPKFSRGSQLEPYLTQFRLTELRYGWGAEESATHLSLALEGTVVHLLLDLAPAELRDLQYLTRELER